MDSQSRTYEKNIRKASSPGILSRRIPSSNSPAGSTTPALRRERTDRHDCSHRLTGRRPSTRTVLLKGVENGKLIFFTNYESRKGRQLTANPYISLSFVWHKLERQVHIEGKAEKCTPQESDAYFSTRPYKSRIGARISPPKSRHQQPDGNNPRFCKGSCQADRTDRTTSPTTGAVFAVTPHPLRILAGTGKQAARPFPIYSPRRKVRFRPIVSKLRKMGDKPPRTLNRTVKVLYPMNKA